MRAGLVALLVFSLAGCALASRERIENAGCTFNTVPEDESGALSYYFPEATGLGTVNCTGGQFPRCNQSVNSAFLSGRSWYLTQDKLSFGIGYNSWLFEQYNIQCPAGHFLHLTMQDINLECLSGNIEGVTVNTSEFSTGRLCTNFDLINSPLYNDGRGVFIEDGRADVEFCSDNGFSNLGFVLRGTCINPVLYYNSPGCVSYTYWNSWDPLFVDQIESMFGMVPTTMVPHKRSAAESAQMFENMQKKIEDLKVDELEVMEIQKEVAKEKRGIRRYFDVPAGTEATYIDSIIRFEFPNGTVQSFPAYCLTAYNRLYGTRFYTRNAVRQIGDTTGSTIITFTGPGFFDLIPSSRGIQAILKWTPQPDFATFLEQDIEQGEIAERIYSYIYNQWVSPYPVIDELDLENRDPKPFPLFGKDNDLFPRGVRQPNQVGVIFPEVQKDSKCRSVILVDRAPLQSARIDPNILRFCAFFQFACDSVLSTACREIMLLDPFDSNPNMMMMGRGGD